MGGVDQVLELVRAPVGGIRREGEHAVVAPVAGSLEVGERQEFDGGDAEIDQIVQPPLEGGIGALGRRGADMQFVHDGLFPGPPRPLAVRPRISIGVDHLGGCRDVIGLKARGGIRHHQIAVDAEAVASASLHARDHGPAPALPDIGNGMIGPIHDQGHIRGGRSPKGKPHTVLGKLAAEPHRMGAPHQATGLRWRKGIDRRSGWRAFPVSHKAPGLRLFPVPAVMAARHGDNRSV